MEFDGWTLLLQAINFLILIWILQRFLYKPLLGLIDRRQRATQSAFTDAEERERKAEEARAQYEARRLEISNERDEMLAEARVKIAEERDEMQGAAEQKAHAELASARSRIERETEEAATAMLQDAVSLAGELANKLLTGVASAAVAGSLLQSALDRLEALPPERLKALRAELGDGESLVVASAPALDADSRERCLERVHAALGAAVTVEFSIDDALVVGAELRFPNARIGYSGRDTLARALEELRGDGRSD